MFINNFFSQKYNDQNSGCDRKEGSVNLFDVSTCIKYFTNLYLEKKKRTNQKYYRNLSTNNFNYFKVFAREEKLSLVKKPVKDYSSANI